MKSLLKEYRYHLGRMIDLAERIGASKEEICNDVIILSAGRLIGFKERRYPAIRQGGQPHPGHLPKIDYGPK